MSDLISRQKILDFCNQVINRNVDGDDINIVVEAFKAFKAYVNSIPSAQPKAIRPKFVAEDRYRMNYFQTFPHCPKCNYELETGDCYCRVCGCHIDWSEDDE